MFKFFLPLAQPHVWPVGCLSIATREPNGSRFLRGFDVASIFVLFVDESFRCLAGVRKDECGDACGRRVWVCRVSVVYEWAGEAAAGGGCAFDLVRETTRTIGLGVWGAAWCAPTHFLGEMD